MIIDDEKLMAFADGELSEDERAEIETALANDARLRTKVENHRHVSARLSAAFDGALSEAVPERLTLATARKQAEVIDLSARRGAQWSVREWGAMAASVALGLVVGIGAMQPPQPMLVATDSGLTAGGALTHALDTQLASETAGDIRIGVSFRDQGGEFCRTFDLTDGGASGVACHGERGWRIPLISSSAAGGEVRTAGAPAEILNAVDQMIAGDPLDAEAERAARDAGWR